MRRSSPYGLIQPFLQRFVSMAVGLCLAAIAIVLVMHINFRSSLSAAITIRMLAVVAAGMIVGAVTGRTACAVFGATIGMLAGDMMFVWFVPPSLTKMWFARQFLLNPIFIISILPGALASSRNRIVGVIASIVLAALPLAACIAMAIVDQRLNPSDNPLKWEGAGFAGALLVPAMVVGGIVWSATAAAVAGIEWWRAKKNRSTSL